MPGSNNKNNNITESTKTFDMDNSVHGQTQGLRHCSRQFIAHTLPKALPEGSRAELRVRLRYIQTVLDAFPCVLQPVPNRALQQAS